MFFENLNRKLRNSLKILDFTKFRNQISQNLLNTLNSQKPTSVFGTLHFFSFYTLNFEHKI